MDSTIRLLDDDSINKIAAGEVIDRPSSVVKELVENSLDAGATRISIEFEAGGLGRICVRDDGKGMAEKDVRMAILRHATSKIRTAEDLLQVKSMGFRGEALPSIAAVSKFTLISRTPEAAWGTRLEMSGGQLTDVVECGCDIGTTIFVADLFFNTPARLKFMKTVATESAHIHEIVLRLSLARPEVSFHLVNNGRTTLQTPGTGLLSDTLAALYGPDSFSQLVTVENFESANASLTGFIGNPSLRKSTRQWQSFTVNRRVVSSRLLSRAVDTAYQTLLPAGMFPLIALHIQLPTDQIDVNVHPQKAEVKFQDEKLIFRLIHNTLRQRLSELGATTDFASPILAETNISPRVQTPSLLIERSQQNIFHLPSVTQTNPPASNLPCDYADHPPLSQNYVRETSAVDTVMAMQSANAEKIEVLAQFKRCYILATDQESLFIIDQHAAHERILYDLLSEQMVPTAFQTLLIPLILDLDPIEVQAAESFAQELANLGFLFDWTGPSSIRLNELPNHVPPQEAEELFRQLLSASSSYKTPNAESFRKCWLETAACHMSVRAGQALNASQMQRLVNDLMQTSRPFSCPHGRPTAIRLSEKELARLFQRT